ncbi:MAG TPA: hypothetical protein VLE69_00245 [Candidatus Saccharimonadales bacterium]|nr:hypothetical protein [Candidatus Saccharimonadales bacterium]
MEPEKSESPQTPKKGGYGKRPMWQWVLLYVVVAIVVYGLIYFLFIHKSGSSGSSGGLNY